MSAELEHLTPGDRRGMKFLVELQELHHLKSSAVHIVAAQINEFFQIVKQTFLDSLPSPAMTSKLEVTRLLEAALEQEKPFSYIKSEYTLKKALEKYAGLVLPTEVNFDTKYGVDKVLQDITEYEATAQVIPFRKSLEQILNNVEIYNYVKAPYNRNESTFASLRDGNYVASHPICKKYDNCLLFGLYEDDVEFTNPLGSYCKTHKLMLSYCIMYNIPEHLLSDLKSMWLVSICKAEYVKEFGFGPAYSDFLETIAELESEKGLALNIRGNVEHFHGTLVCALGDTLAMNVLGGFKASVGGANRPCRVCYADKNDISTTFYVEKEKLRSRALHMEQLKQILNNLLTKKERDDMSVEWGISTDSILNDNENFDVTICLIMDLMHNLLEGVVEISIKCILKQFIEVDELLTFDTLNHLIQCFPYPKQMKSDKPSIIERTHVLKGNLRQSASQRACLLVILPFILAPFVKDGNKYLSNFILLCQLSQNLLAYNVKKESIDFLKYMLFVHHTQFSELYPDVSITPKFHFLLHAPDVIALFGPCRSNWCMRCEARHAWFKHYAKLINNCKNLEKSLAIGFQIKRALDLGLGQVDHIVLGGRTFSFVKTADIEISNIPFGKSISEMFGLMSGSSITAAEKVSIKNFDLEQNTLLMYENLDDELPKFGKVVSLFVNNDKCAIVLKNLETEFYDGMRNAYVLKETEEFQVLNSQSLPSLQSVPSFVYANVFYAVLTYFDRNEFCG